MPFLISELGQFFGEQNLEKNLGRKNTLFSTFRDPGAMVIASIVRSHDYHTLPTSNHYLIYIHTSLTNDLWILAFYTPLLLPEVGKEKPIWSGLAFVTTSCLPYLSNMTIKFTLQHQSRSLLRMRRKLRSL